MAHTFNAATGEFHVDPKTKLDGDGWYHLKLSRRRTKIRTYINGQRVRWWHEMKNPLGRWLWKRTFNRKPRFTPTTIGGTDNK